MGCMLVNQHNAGFGLGHDVIVMELGAGCTQGIFFGQHSFSERCGERHVHFKGGLPFSETAVG